MAKGLMVNTCLQVLKVGIYFSPVAFLKEMSPVTFAHAIYRYSDVQPADVVRMYM